jgi:hypothetical protein
VVGYDGALYAMVQTGTGVFDGWSREECHQNPTVPNEYRSTVSVVRVTAEGAAAVFELETAEGSEPVYLGVQGGTLVPDPRGGVHAEWTYGTRHARVGPGVSEAAQSGPLGFDRIGDGVGFDGSGTAYDLDTGAVRYTPSQQGWFVTALAGGGVAVTDGEMLTTLDENGEVVGTPTPMPKRPASSTFGIFGGGALWAVVDDGRMSRLEGEALSNEPAIFPDLNGVRQPGMPGAKTVSVHFGPDAAWLDPPPLGLGLTVYERDLVKRTAFETMKTAYQGFCVEFMEDEREPPLVNNDPTNERHVYVLNTDGPNGAAGKTEATAAESSVYLIAQVNSLRVMAGCSALFDDCGTRPRVTLVTALGRGLGATIAHEFGHQGGVWEVWTQDDYNCMDCYDSPSANTPDHFFSPLHWTEAASVIMNRVLRLKQ